MKYLPVTLSSLIILSSLQAGELSPDMTISREPVEKKIKPTVDLRARYEFREDGDFDPSHALTTRGRFGLMLGDFNGFSAFAEGEATAALIDDFNAGSGANPINLGNTSINDSENYELNQAWIEYKNEEFASKIGRQRLIRNNAAFIGNVGWRQNEQTFDAVNLAWTRADFSISYAYANRVQRIFGHEAQGAGRKFEGDVHLLDAALKTKLGQLGSYAYLADIENQNNVGRSNTFGLFLSDPNYRIEFAYQDGDSALAGGSYDSLYAHLNYTHAIGDSSLGLGIEYLGRDFKTPLATVHSFNGFADSFAGQRLGLNDLGGRYDGMSDFYLEFSQKGLPAGLTFKATLHHFRDDSLSATYGNEVDVVLIKKFSENLSTLLKAACFLEEDGLNGFEDIQQISVEMDYIF